MRTTLLLCDYAQEVGGKLYILGGGWSIYRGAPVTMGLAVKIAVPWDAANIPHDFSARLVTEDGGDPVLPQAEGGAAPTRPGIPGAVRNRAPARPDARQRPRRAVRREHRRAAPPRRPLRVAGRDRRRTRRRRRLLGRSQLTLQGSRGAREAADRIPHPRTAAADEHAGTASRPPPPRGGKRATARWNAIRRAVDNSSLSPSLRPGIPRPLTLGTPASELRCAPHGASSRLVAKNRLTNRRDVVGGWWVCTPARLAGMANPATVGFRR